MTRHLAVFVLLLGAGYLAVRFGGVPGKYMLAIPPLFVIYLGIALLMPKAEQKIRRGKK